MRDACDSRRPFWSAKRFVKCHISDNVISCRQGQISCRQGQNPISGALRTTCCHAPATSRILVVLSPNFMLDVERVNKSLTHFRASTKWIRTFDPDIIYDMVNISGITGRGRLISEDKNEKRACIYE